MILHTEKGMKTFNTDITVCAKIGEAAFIKKHLIDYSPKCVAANQYIEFVSELLGEEA